MTIAIIAAVPDGIAVSADTQTAWSRSITTVKAKGVKKPVELENPIRMPMGWSPGAKKLFPFSYGGRTGVVLTAGVASIGKRSAGAIFRKLERECPDTASCEQIVQYLADGIRAEFRRAHGTDDLTTVGVSVLEFIFAAFVDGDITRPFVSSNLTFTGTVPVAGKPDSSGHHQRWTNEPDAYGACWIGQTQYVAHLVNHKNRGLPPIAGQYHMMTLEEAVAYTRFLAEFTCDYQQFAAMVPDCGRPVVSAVLTPEGFKYVENAPPY